MEYVTSLQNCDLRNFPMVRQSYDLGRCQYFLEGEERKRAVKSSYCHSAVSRCPLALLLPVVILFYVFALVDLFVFFRLFEN